MLIPIPSLVRAGNLDSFLKVGLKFYVFFTLLPRKNKKF